jgi:hypothetical protein
VDLFQTNIDGPYALLLVLQILVVSGLLLTLIWLFIYRAREMKQIESSFVGQGTEALSSGFGLTPSLSNTMQSQAAFSSQESPIIVPGSNDGLMDLTAATLGEFSDSVPAKGLYQTGQGKLDTQSPAPGDGIFEMQKNPSATSSVSDESPNSQARQAARPDPSVEDSELLHNARAETEELRHKIEYLEGKLLEYEIVQEEISNLSSLKMENEKLREEVVKLQRTAKPTPQAAAPSVPPGASASETAHTSDEAGILPLSASSRDTTILMPGAFAGVANANAEPSLNLGAGSNVSSEYPPEPLPNNVLAMPLVEREHGLASAKQTADAFQDPLINTQIEKILSKLEQLTNK